MKKLLLFVFCFVGLVFGQEVKDENNNGLRDDVEVYLSHAIPPYNSILFAGFDYAFVLQRISETKWKKNDQFKILAQYYAKRYIEKSACFDAVYFKKVEFTYENREKLRDIKTTLKALIFDSVEKSKRFAKFNGLLSGKVFKVIVVNKDNLDKIISKYCSKEVKNYLKSE